MPKVGTTIDKDTARLITKPTQKEIDRMIRIVNGKRLRYVGKPVR